MILTIIIFFLALIGAFGLVGRRLWEVRTGKIIIEPTYELADWTELSIEEIRDQMVLWLRIALHHTVLFALKVWIKTSYTVKSWDASVREKLVHVLHKNGHLPPGGKPSNFLKRVSAHKSAVMSQIAKEGKIVNNGEGSDKE